MLRLSFDVGTLVTSLARDGDWLKTTSNEILELDLKQRNQPYQLATGQSIILNIRPKGKTDGDLLAQAVVAVSDYDSATGLYSVIFSAYTETALAFLLIGNDVQADDVADPQNVEMAPIWQKADSSTWEGQTALGVLERALYLPDEPQLVPLPIYSFALTVDESYLEAFKNGVSIGKMQLAS